MNINRSYLRVAIIVIALMIGTISAASAEPFEINGSIFYGDDSKCNNSTVNIANLDTNSTWAADTNEGSNDYEMVLDSDNVSVNDILQFTATSPDGSQSSVTKHVVTLDELNDSGFVYNITLVESADETAPEITSVVLNPTMVEQNGRINVTVTVTDDMSGVVNVTADGNPLTDAGNGTWVGPITAAGTPGTHNVTVVATDASNNRKERLGAYMVPIPVLPTIYIDDVTLRQGSITTTSITVFDVMNMGGCELLFEYDPAVVYVADVARGDLNFSFEYNIDNGSGWMRANALDVSGLSGNVTFAKVTLAAVGNKNTTSEMKFRNSRLVNASFGEIDHQIDNGVFSILPNVLPVVTNASTTQDTILYDNGRPRTPGTNTTLLSARVTDADGNITAVTIDLSSIGGSPDQSMKQVGDMWELTTNATGGGTIPPDFIHHLAITATDDNGATNDPVSINLTVLKRGDVNGDGSVDKMDADYISRYLAGLEPEASNPPGVLVGDVIGKAGSPIGNDVVDLIDALYIAKYTRGVVAEEP